MNQTNDFLFVYGTLLGDDNDFAIYLKKYGSFYCQGKLKGKLYDLGEYPGAVLDEYSESYIYGNIVRLINPNQTLNYLDDYEGFGEEQEKPNLFLRKITPVETNNRLVDCWIYLYNLSVEGLILIESGDYIAYRKLIK